MGGEGVVDPVAQHVAQLGLGGPPVQAVGGDEHHVVDAGLGRQLEHRLDHPLAVVGARHRREGHGLVVEGDGELHPRAEQGPQGLAVADGVLEGVADGAVGVGQGVDGLGRVDHPAAGGQLLQPEALAVVEQDGRRRPVDLQDETGPTQAAAPPIDLADDTCEGELRELFVGAQRRFSPRRSNTTLTAPRDPALAAWSMASR